jgi:site-specific recombinase XerD
MIEDMKLRNYAPRTIKIYVKRVATFAEYFDKSPQRLGAADIRAYLLFLVQEKEQPTSASYYGQAISALRFLYRSTLGKKWVVDDVVSPKKQRRERSIFIGSRGDLCCSRKCLSLKLIPASRLVVRT